MNKSISLMLWLFLAFHSIVFAADKEKITLQLKWFHSFQFAGYYAALEKGYYKELGLEVSFRERNPKFDPIEDVLAGKADYGITDTGLILESSRNQSVVLVAQIFQHSPLIFMTRKEDNIRNPLDLKNKKITTNKSGITDTPLLALLHEAFGSLDNLNFIPYTYRNDDLIDGKTDAFAGYITDQPFYFKQKHMPINILDPRDYGIDFYGDNLFTHKDELRNNPERVEKMRAASLKGWQYALKHPYEIIDLISKKYNTKNQNREHLAYEAAKIAELILPEYFELGSFQESRFQKIIQTYAKFGFIDNINIDPEFFYTSFKHDLTANEVSWLKQHQEINVVLDPGWAPIEYDDAGKFKGISVDYLTIIAKKIGIKFNYSQGMSWQEGVQAIKDKQFDMFASVSKTTEREKFTLFTKPYVSFPIKIFANKNTSYIGGLNNLKNKQVAVVDGYAINEWLKKNHKNIQLLQVKTPLEGLRLVSEDKIHAFVGNVVSASYYIRKFNLDNVRISGETPYSNNQSMSVRNDWPVLANILQKALNSISHEEHELIFNSWMSLQFEQKINYQLIWKILIVVLLVLMMILYWNRRLSFEVKQRKLVEGELLKQQQVLEDRVKERTKEMTYLAYHDALTDLPNRILFSEHLDIAIQRAKRNNTTFAVLFIDLDDFKQVNDSFDHSYGDHTLTKVAQRMLPLFRGADTLARMGGDEFTVILNDITYEEDAAIVAQKILGLFSHPIEVKEQQFFLGASIGISIYPSHGTSVEELVRNADSAMYKSKSSGRNTYTFYSEELTKKAKHRISIESDLRKAIDNQEFSLNYQAQFNLLTNEICGLEALVRWNHPENGLISPLDFIPISETTGLIIPLGEWILNQSCQDMKSWIDLDLINDDITLSVNFSAVQFDQDNLSEMIQQALDKSGLDNEVLEMEITESTMMNKPDYSKKILNKLRQLGIKIAIDDFGTGYSSLSHLKLLPLTKLKIDQSFVFNIPKDKNDMAIAIAVINLAKSLSLDVLAEGIETQEQLDFLAKEGCNMGQGYLFSKPLTADDFKQFLIEKKNH